MADTLTINVTNETGHGQPFFIFQQPPHGLAGTGSFPAFSPWEHAPPEPVPGQAFPIVALDYTPSSAYHAGLTVPPNGGTMPSHLVTATIPNSFESGPTPAVYVQTGRYEPGTIIDVPQPSANVAPGTHNISFAFPAILDHDGNVRKVQF